MKVYIVAIEEALSEKSCVPVRYNTPYPTKVILSGMVELCLLGRFNNEMPKIKDCFLYRSNNGICLNCQMAKVERMKVQI